MRVYLDDIRQAPNGNWELVKTVRETINLLKTGEVTHLSLDHDLGTLSTGYDALLWIEEAVATHSFIPPKITIHTSNASARKKMEMAVESIKRLCKNDRNYSKNQSNMSPSSLNVKAHLS